MATRCCDHHISCPGAGNLDFDSPFANLSAEAPDIDFYIGINWGWDRNVPRLGSWWTRNSCLGVCESGVSQADADACAARNQLACLGDDHWKPPPIEPVTDGVPFNGPRLPRRLDLFPNNPETCIASCPDGIGFAFTTPAGQFISPSQILSDRMALSEACRFAIFAKICLSSLSPNEVCTGKQYLAVIHATGGTAPMSFSLVAGTVPPGIVLSQGPGDHDLTLAGIPTAGGAYQFTIRCEDAVGHFMQKTFTLGVAGIEQATVPDGQVGIAYADTLTASNLTLPFTWTISSGTLPAGLSLNSASGEIFGTPTTAGTSTFTVQCTDGIGVACTRQYTLTVAPALACPLADGTVAIVDPFGAFPYFCQYAPSLEVAHPNKYFSSISDGMAEVDADTKTFIRSTLYGGNLFILSQNAVFSPTQRRVYFSVQDTGTSDIFIKSIDAATQAIASSAAYPAPTTALWRLVYDSVHDQVALTKDTAIGSFLVIFNSATLAEISSFQIASFAAGERARHFAYDPLRDRYWVTIFNGGGTPILLRVFDRATGAKLIEIHVTDIDDLGIAYGALTDKIYYRRASVVPLVADLLEIRNAATGALEDTVSITGCLGGLWAVYDSNRELIWCNNGTNTFFGVSTASKTMACTMAGLRYSPGFFGSKIAVRGPAPGPMNFFL